MRILRSQYLKLKTNADEGLTAASANTKIIGKKLPTKKQTSVNKKSQLTASTTTSSSAVLPIRSLRSDNRDFLYSTSTTPNIGTNIKIVFDHVDGSLDKLNVVVEFINMDAMWLTRVYRTYENELWHKKPRCNVVGTKKQWFFYCHLCDNVYSRFNSIKNHLNLHMKLYPYVCKLCSMKYTARHSATRHLWKKHRLSKANWNDYLTS